MSKEMSFEELMAKLEEITTKLEKDNLNLDESVELFEELDDLLRMCEECVEWGKAHKFFPFQLPFEESLIHSDDYNIDLFVPSAYAKYIDYKEVEERIKSYKNKIN